MWPDLPLAATAAPLLAAPPLAFAFGLGLIGLIGQVVKAFTW